MKLLRLLIMSLGASLLSLSLGMQVAFGQVGTCPDLVEFALQEIGENCTDVSRNSACYGYNQVSATFTEPVPDDYFVQPADQAELISLDTLATSPLNLDEDIWGVAIMNVQANVPDTIPGQAVTFVVMGDAQVENQVVADNAFIGNPVAIMVAGTLPIYVSASNSASVLAQLPPNTPIQVDAISPDGTWVRVQFEDQIGWSPQSSLEGVDSSVIASLPVLAPGARTPMQAFYFSTGVGRPVCNEAPDVVTINSPENISVDLNVNGVDVRIGSTITFKNDAQGNALFTVQDGTLETVNGLIVEAGQTLVAQLDEEGNVISFLDVRPATPDELAFGESPGALLEQVTGRPTGLGDDDNPQTRVNENGEVIHIVQAGETLFSIARLYDASMPAIVNRNNLSDPRRIFVGQELVIPNPGSGFVSLPTLPGDDTTGDGGDGTLVGGSCADLTLIAPTDGLKFGSNTFEWTPVAGASQYQVIVNNLEEGTIGVFSTVGTETTLTASIDQETVGWGFSFGWSVVALDESGARVCETEVVTMQRENVVDITQPPVSGPAFTASWACTGFSGEFAVTWSGAAAGDTITISFDENLPFLAYPVTLSGSGSSGSITYTALPSIGNGVISTSSGLSATLLPATLTC